MKKIINTLKIIALYIKKAIRFVLKLFTRSVYAIIALGYVASLIAVYFVQDYVKDYNQQALEYTKIANQSAQAYNTLKNVDQLQDNIEQRLKEQYKTAEANISKSIKNVDEKDLAKEMLFKKKKIEDTTFVQNIKTEVKESFNIDLKKEFNSLTAQQKTNPVLDKIAELLTSNKIVIMVLLLLSFPFLSPIVLACVVLVIMTKKYLKRVSNPNEANYITMVPSLYITNMVIGIAAVAAYYFCNYAGFAIAAAGHGLFILKVINGIRLKKMGECLSCGQALPTEDEQIAKLKTAK